MVRRLKRDVLTQLPPKRREQVYIALDKKTDAYRELKGVQEQLQQLMEWQVQQVPVRRCVGDADHCLKRKSMDIFR